MSYQDMVRVVRVSVNASFCLEFTEAEFARGLAKLAVTTRTTLKEEVWSLSDLLCL